MDKIDQTLEQAFSDMEKPTVDQSRKERAVVSAMQQFKKRKKIIQGQQVTRRLTSKRSILTLGDQLMKKITLYGGTATALGVAAFFTLSTMDDVPHPTGLDKKEDVNAQTSPQAITSRPAHVKMEENTKVDNVKSSEISFQSSPVLANDLMESGGRETAKIAEEAAPLAPAIAPMTQSYGGDMSAAPLQRHAAIGRPSHPNMVIMPVDSVQPHIKDAGRDQFDAEDSNPLKSVSEAPVSTFSIDVDTASYSFMRSSLNNGGLPNPDSVRIEELVNYFDYDYTIPADKAAPFEPNIAVYQTPWNAQTKIMHIGIKGYELAADATPRSNLVFLIDISGSMSDSNKLPLLVNGFKLMVDSLHPEDTISIVTYAGRAGTVLEPTKVKDKHMIINALNQLQSGGSTAGAAGIEQAYALAKSSYNKDAVNRVILATDGDFNVGITNRDELKSYIERQRDDGIYLSVLGFGRGNYNDALMQKLAQNGNGNAYYIDSLNEARKVLVDESGSTLFTIAKDVKIQVEFNPEAVAEYRLIGYETRMLKREDFNNDKIDAGEIGAGHSVTALYEITPVGSDAQLIDDLRYQPAERAASSVEGSGEYAFLKLRYKLPESSVSTLMTTPIDASHEAEDTASLSDDMRFAASVAAFGQKLKSDRYLNDFSYDEIIALANPARGEDNFGYRAEFVNLLRLAKNL